jgi:hypothetical protein
MNFVVFRWLGIVDAGLLRFPHESSVPLCMSPIPKSDPRPILRIANGCTVGVIDDVMVNDGVNVRVNVRVLVNERVNVRVRDKVRVNDGVRLRDGVNVWVGV